jgi:branched-chain amino acid transport system permease protein
MVGGQLAVSGLTGFKPGELHQVNTSLFFQIMANGVMMGGMYALVASGLTLILGVIKVMNFAQGQLYMLGAFVTFAVTSSMGLPYPVALLTALAGVGVLGVVLYFVAIRWTLRHGFFHSAVVTTLVAVAIGQGATVTLGGGQRIIQPLISGTLTIRGVSLSWGKLLVILCAVAVMAALYFFMRSRLGTAMLAAAENDDVASLQGINGKRIFWITMLVGCALSGVAGGLILPVQGATIAMGGNIFNRALVVLIIGGMGSMSGALIAAFLVGIVESFAFQFVGYYNFLIVFGMMVVLCYFRPGGLLGKPLPVPGE